MRTLFIPMVVGERLDTLETFSYVRLIRAFRTHEHTNTCVRAAREHCECHKSQLTMANAEKNNNLIGQWKRRYRARIQCGGMCSEKIIIKKKHVTRRAFRVSMSCTSTKCAFCTNAV